MSHLKPVELRADESAGGQIRGAVVLAEQVDGLHQLTGDAVGQGMLVGHLESEDVPDSDEQLAGDRDNGLVTAEARSETGKLGLPVGMGVGGDLGSFDESGAEFAASGLGDLASASSEARVVNAGTQPGVTDQVLGIGEAGDIADGRQDGEGGDNADARKLGKEG